LGLSGEMNERSTMPRVARCHKHRHRGDLRDIRVITGLVPVIPIRLAPPCLSNRDRRDKPGDDK
jgi:hypothetical protein